jgi:hypothetical protein
MKGQAIKKPVTINWFLWQGDLGELEDWHTELTGKPIEDNFLFNENGLRVKTLEGHSYEVPNNYVIIMGTANEFYPHEYELFKQNYSIKEDENN